MKTVLKYPGAKNRIAGWICSHIPAHDVYVEAFCGSAGVLLNKPRCHIETINDIDDEIVNLFSIIRNNSQEQELKELLKKTPYAREEYNRAFLSADDVVERARRYLVRCWMGFGSSNVYKNGFKTGQQAHSPAPSKTWNELPEIIDQVCERLQGVQIEKLPALELMRRYDTPDVFMYLDPPYLPSTRKNYLYSHEMTLQDHEELLKECLAHPGKIMISGYDNDFYNEYLKGWTKVSCRTQAECGIRRTETLWMNYTEGQQLSFSF